MIASLPPFAVSWHAWPQPRSQSLLRFQDGSAAILKAEYTLGTRLAWPPSFLGQVYMTRFKMVDDASVGLNFESLEDFVIICHFMNEDEDNVSFNAMLHAKESKPHKWLRLHATLKNRSFTYRFNWNASKST